MEWQEETIQHLRSHIEPILPAIGSEVVDVCNNMTDVPDQDREIILARLDPEKNYETLDDILVDINTEN